MENTQSLIVVNATETAIKGKTIRAASPKLTHYLGQGGFRPGSGRALFSHTAAVLELSGLNRGAKIPRATLTKIMGETAVKYHLAQCNFDWDASGISLTAMGREYLVKIRNAGMVDPELKAAFIDVLSTGKPNDKVCKNPVGIKAL